MQNFDGNILLQSGLNNFIFPHFGEILECTFVCSYPRCWHERSSAQGQWSRGPSWSQASISIRRFGWFQQDSPFPGLGWHTGNKSSGGETAQTCLHSACITADIKHVSATKHVIFTLSSASSVATVPNIWNMLLASDSQWGWWKDSYRLCGSNFQIPFTINTVVATKCETSLNWAPCIWNSGCSMYLSYVEKPGTYTESGLGLGLVRAVSLTSYEGTAEVRLAVWLTLTDGSLRPYDGVDGTLTPHTHLVQATLLVFGTGLRTHTHLWLHKGVYGLLLHSQSMHLCMVTLPPPP